jgi:chromate transporter
LKGPDDEAVLQRRAAAAPDADDEATLSPASPRALFTAFNRLALQGFGGVIPVAQRELVERERWLSRQGFLELLSISQVLPGPNIVNLALIFGDRCFGWRGALAAIGGILAAPLLLVLVLAVAVRQAQGLPAVVDALRGMGVVAAGLVLSTAWRLAGGLRRNRLGVPLCAGFVVLTLLAVAVLRWPLAAVVLGLGTVSMALAWRRL